MGPEVAKLGQNTAFKKQWISLTNGKLTRLIEGPVQDEIQQDIIIIHRTKTHPSADTLKELKRRKLIDAR